MSDHATKPPAKPRRRLSPAEREQQILSKAIQFFSDRGLEGQTRDLAREIGITHPLLYHYFPTKKALIERVYQEVYLGRWKTEWEEWLDSDSLGLEEKLNRFYLDYATNILTPEWVRIMVFSGLSDGYIPGQYLRMLKTKLFPRIARETRKHLGLPASEPCTSREIQLIEGFHGGIFYIGILQWVYDQPAPDDQPALLKDRVRGYIAAAERLFSQPAETELSVQDTETS